MLAFQTERQGGQQGLDLSTAALVNGEFDELKTLGLHPGRQQRPNRQERGLPGGGLVEQMQQDAEMEVRKLALL